MTTHRPWLLSLALLSLMLGGGCSPSARSNSVSVAPDPASELASAPASLLEASTVEANDHLIIGAWNVENLGPSFLQPPKRPKLTHIAHIIVSCHLMAVQEVADVSGKVQRELEAEVQAINPAYRMLLSPRTGRQPDDRKQQEQYAIFYDSRALELQGNLELYDDQARDEFAREPAYAQFKTRTGGWTFAIAVIHTDPRRAAAEISALPSVIDVMRQQYPMEDDFLVVGDFNAGQRYVRTVDWNMMANGIRNPMHFAWIVPDSADTTTALGEDQAHDRIIGTNTVQAQWTGTWEVMKTAFTLSEGLSDHYPVWASFVQNER